MSWRDDLIPGAFRDVPFGVLGESKLTGGRRLRSFDVPNAEQRITQDLGAKGRDGSLQVYVVGDDYIARRAALIEALERPGPGGLDHPYLGPLTVRIDSYDLVERTDEGRMARITINFVEDNEAAFVGLVVSTKERAAAAIAASRDQVKSKFLELSLRALSANVSTLVNTPSELIEEVDGAFEALLAAGDSVIRSIGPLAYFAGLLPDFSNLDDSFAAEESTAARQQGLNNAAMDEAVTRLAATWFGSALLDYTPTTREEAEDLRRDWLAVTETMIGGESADLFADADSLRTTEDLRHRVVDFLDELAIDLPSSRTLRVRTPRSTLELAQELYGDGSRASEIEDSNGVLMPGFIEPGELQVLTS